MIELAIGSIRVDLDNGDIVDIEAPQSWLEGPAEDLSLEIERLTHITSAMLIGQWFRDAEIDRALAGCDGIAAIMPNLTGSLSRVDFRTQQNCRGCVR